jgi:hypothetical protein
MPEPLHNKALKRTILTLHVGFGLPLNALFSTRPRLATERAGRFANHRTRYGPATEGVAGDSLRLALDAE